MCTSECEASHGCASVFVGSRARVCALCVCVYRSEVNTGCFPQLLSTLCFGTKFLTKARAR